MKPEETSVSIRILRMARSRLAVLTISLSALYFICRCTGSVIVDGFQSLGAVAGASAPGCLRWPMLGEFLGYNQAWGFHWIGWPMLRSLALPVLPWSPALDLGLCLMIWGVSCWILSRIVEREDTAATGTQVAITCVLSPNLLIAAQSYRPEVPTALALVIALGLWNQQALGKRIAAFLMCVLLPCLHPLGLIVPAAWCGFDFVSGVKTLGFLTSLRRALVKGMPLLFGTGILAFWFVSQPIALNQFRLNLESQRMLISGLGTGYATFFRWGFGSLGSLPLVVLLATSALFSIWRILRFYRLPGQGEPNGSFYASVALIVALAFNILAKNPNSLHLVAVLPFAAWLFVSAVRMSGQWVCNHGTLIPLSLSWLLLLVFPGKQAMNLVRNHGVSYRGELERGLRSLPAADRVLIPVAMWEAAISCASERGSSYRFSTFPNLMTASLRADYERDLLSQTQPGDLLVWDELQDHGGIFNFVTATALRHQVIRPAEDAGNWERLPDLVLQTVYSKSQAKVFEVYRKR